MNRVLSLLLLVPFLITQVLTVAPAFARGGPYDDMLSKSASALAGTYGVALTGVGDTTNDYQWQKSTKDPNNVTDVPNKGEVPTNASHLPASNVTGVMAMSLPATGMATGRVLLFKEGLMYVGTAQGVLDSRSGKIRLLSQLTHYFLRIGTDGVQGATNLETIDSMYTGQINLNLAIDYFSGLIEATGDARFSEYNPFMSSTTTSVLPIATSVTTQGFITLIPGPGISAPTTTGSTNTAIGALTATSNSVTPTVSTSGTVQSSLTRPGTVNFSNRIETSSLSAITFNGGSTFVTPNATITTNPAQITTTTFYNNATQRSGDVNNQAKQLELYLTADGVRQGATVATISPFIAPSAATSFQVELPQ